MVLITSDGGDHYSSIQYDQWLMVCVCVCPIQVLYSLQGPVLWLGVRRSLQTGGWQHQVSNVLG